MSPFFKKVFSADNFFATAFIFGVMWLFSTTIQINSDALNPIEDMFRDFELTDLISSRIREEQPEDTNIVIVNIGNFSRREIARQISIINECKPKVMGIDCFFRMLKSEDPSGDTLLAEAFSNVNNLVLVSKLHYSENAHVFDSLETSHPLFTKNAEEGFANLITEGEERFKTARVFSPFDTVYGHRTFVDTFFAVKLAEIYRPGSARLISDRKKDFEYIRYKGNIYGIKAKYFTIEAQDILDGNFLPELLKNKIVLLGYLGGEISNSENIWDFDKFFTPLNDNYVGKATPDMFGVVVHANIISMILNQNFVDQSDKWLEYSMAFVLCFLCVVFFHFLLLKVPELFDPSTKIFQLIFIIILIYIEILIYYKKNYRLELGIALTAIALAPDLLEIYLHIIKRSVTYFIKKKYINIKFLKLK